MCFFISDNAVTIDNPTFQILGKTKIFIPGLMEYYAAQGKPAPYVTIPVVAGFLLLGFAIFIAHYTRIGRTIYAIGGNEGRNEQSARLMGFPLIEPRCLSIPSTDFVQRWQGSRLASLFFLDTVYTHPAWNWMSLLRSSWVERC